MPAWPPSKEQFDYPGSLRTLGYREVTKNPEYIWLNAPEFDENSEFWSLIFRTAKSASDPWVSWAVPKRGCKVVFST